MSESQIWLGECQVVYSHQAGQPDAQRYRVQVAAWCSNPGSFGRAVESRMAESGLTLLHTGTPLPKEQWLAQHQGEPTPWTDAETQQLANKAGQYGNTALGYLYATPEEAKTTTQSYLHIETLDNIEPLDGQFDVHPPKTVPDKLYEPLFGQPEPTEQETEQYGGKDQVPPMKLYAILDAAKVKVPGLRSMLDTSGLDFACLVTGEDYEALKDSAPYIVELKEDNDFTRTLFTYNPKFSDEHLSVHLWHKEPGIYIRSRASLVELGQHFAKFVRVQDERGKGYFFRFWESKTANHYFCGLKKNAEKIADWFLLNDTGKVDTMLIQSNKSKSNYVSVVSPTSMLKHEKRNFVLTKEEWDLLSLSVEESFYKQLIKDLSKEFPNFEHDTIRDMVERNKKDANNFGLSSKRDIYALNRAMLKRGEHFFKKEPFYKDFERIKGDPTQLGKYMRLWAA